MKQEEKKILLSYKKAHNQLKSKIALLFERYSVGDTLTLNDMQKYNRMKSLIKDIEHQYRDIAKIEMKELFRGLEREYQVNYLFQGWDIENKAGVKLRYGMVDKNLVRSAINNELSGLPISERVSKNIRNNIYDIRTAITQGLVQGESYQSIAKRLKEEQEKHAYQAKRIIQTESHRIQNEARNEAIHHAEDLGIVIKKRWMSAGDAVVRDTHDALDGQYADKDGLFHLHGHTTEYPGGFGIAEEDINCRCTVVTEVERVGDKTFERAEWLEQHDIPKDVSQEVIRLKK